LNRGVANSRVFVDSEEYAARVRGLAGVH